MKHIFSAWSKLAVVTFNSIILVLVVAVLIETVLNWRHQFGGRPAVTPSVDFDLLSFREVDAPTAKAIAMETDVYASSQPFVYNPWTTSMLAPYRGDAINVEDDPVLTHRRVPPSTKRGVERTVVWAFGGSTMFGWGVDDRHAIPSLLQEELQNRLPGKAVDVVNFGQPYWYSSSEVAGFMALLRSRPAPDAVVFLDGLNDVAWISSGLSVPVMAGQARKAWDRARMNALRELPWFSVNASFPFRRVLDWLVYRNIVKPVQENDGYHHPPADAAQAIVTTYRANRQMTMDLCASRGTRAFFFLQPMPWFGAWGEGRVNRDFPFGDKAKAIEAIQILNAEAEKSTVARFHSLTEVLRSVERPFIDGTHYSDASNRIIARRMAELMVVGDSLN